MPGKIIMIAAVDNNNGIGNNSKLLFSIPEDIKFFKETTDGHVCVMGANTIMQIGHALVNRVNLVLTHHPNNTKKYRDNMLKFTAECCPKTYPGSFTDYKECNLDTLDMIIEQYLADGEDVYIIGGEQIYNLFIDRANVIYLTRYNKTFEADKHFPDMFDHGFDNCTTTKISSGEFEGAKYIIQKFEKIQ